MAAESRVDHRRRMSRDIAKSFFVEMPRLSFHAPIKNRRLLTSSTARLAISLNVLNRRRLHKRQNPTLLIAAAKAASITDDECPAISLKDFSSPAPRLSFHASIKHRRLLKTATARIALDRRRLHKSLNPILLISAAEAASIISDGCPAISLTRFCRRHVSLSMSRLRATRNLAKRSRPTSAPQTPKPHLVNGG
jgi:hypothetical protein